MTTFVLIPSVFFAGLLTFFAPCTLPLVPAFLAFMNGVSVSSGADGTQPSHIRRKVLYNTIAYLFGFSAVFIVFGSVLVALGGLFLNQTMLLQRIGGIFVLLFGVCMLLGDRLPRFLKKMNVEKRFHLHHLVPGKPSSAFLMGATFAFGWTPCVGPILGSVLVLAATTTTLLQGIFLLIIFSIGLSIPFLVLALGIGHAATYMRYMKFVMKPLNFLGGLLLLFLGILLLTGDFGLWLGWVYRYLHLESIQSVFFDYL